MLLLLKMLQSLVRTLHSEGTPGQIAAGITLGAALGLTPLFSPHNIFVLIALILLNVSFGAGLLGMALFAPIGFLIDPLADAIGNQLLTATPMLEPLWQSIANAPLLALLHFNNTIVVGSLALWALLTVPIYLLALQAVRSYRASVGMWVRHSKVYKAVRASRVYNVYSWFRE
jgi:uncharacterized protein (TIGR03546 family)